MVTLKKEESKLNKVEEDDDDIIGDSIDIMMGTGVKFDVSVDIA